MTTTGRKLTFIPIGISSFLFFFVVVTTAGCTCEGEKAGEDGSNTNWLTYCEASSDCEGDGSCICGLCTQTCKIDEECFIGERPASCVDPGPASAAGGCAIVVRDANVKICLPDCVDSDDCGERSICILGACWRTGDDIVDERGNWPFDIGLVPSDADAEADAFRSVYPEGSSGSAGASGSVSPDGSSGSAGASGSVSPDGSSGSAGAPGSVVPDGVDAAVDLSQPIYLPPPQTIITGDFSRSSLLGIWEESADNYQTQNGPIRLVIQEAPNSDGLVGDISFLCGDDTCDPTGPLPPAVDPDIAYPPETSGAAIINLRNWPMARFDYRIFDGRMDGQHFSFWYTNDDLWRDWCALQTPYPVHDGDRLEYACLPDAVRYTTMLSMVLLSGKEPLCALGGGVCECNSDTCDVNYRSNVRQFDLAINADVMQGTFTVSFWQTYLVTLYKIEGQQP